MHVAVVIHDLSDAGGQETVAWQSVRRMLDDGLRVTAVVADLGAPADARRDLEVRTVPCPDRPNLLRGEVFRRRATRIVRDLGADLVHAHGAIVADADVYTCHFCHGARGPETGDMPVLESAYRRMYTARQRALERDLYPGGRRVCAVGPGVAAELVEHCGVDADRVRTVLNGTDPEHHRKPTGDERTRARRDLGVPEDAWVWGFAGAMGTPRKGLDTALAALEHAPDAHLVAAGPGAPDPGDLPAAVRARVILPGWVEDVRQVWWAADAAVFPARYEPFGLAPLEAAACGTPVVVSACAGVTAVLADGEAALHLADPRDAAGLAAAAGRLRADGDLRERVRSGGRAAAEARTWDAVWRDQRAVYDELDAGRGDAS